MDFSAKLSLPYLLPNQAHKHVTMNETLRALDALVHLSVQSNTLANPPVDPTDGDRYIPAMESSGTWAGHAGHIACFQDGGWRFYTPQSGWLAWLETDQRLIVFDGNEWIDPAPEAQPSAFGVNTSADAYNRLAVRSQASLFTHEGSGHQLKINKADASDTASILFQSDWQGRAEIGLAGSDDFVVKTSPDGSSFDPTIIARASDGYVGLGTWSPTAKLHVDGAVRIGSVSFSALPDPNSMGAGSLIWVSDAPNGAGFAYSDGEQWRGLDKGGPIS